MIKLLSEYNKIKEGEGYGRHSETRTYVYLFEEFVNLISLMGYCNFKIGGFTYSEWVSSNQSHEYVKSGKLLLAYQTHRENKYDWSSVTLSANLKDVDRFGCMARYRKAITSIVKSVYDYCDSLDKIINTLDKGTINEEEVILILEKNKVPKEEDMIQFPEMRRGELCTSFVPISNWNKLTSVTPGDIITLKGTRKNSKELDYVVLDINEDETIAIKDSKTGKILFLQDRYEIECAYDALFPCNKQEVAGWWNRTKKVVVN